jgi:hypothetical protein
VRRRFVMCAFGGFGAAAVLMLGSMGASAQTWTEYRPAGGGFQVEMPGTPHVITDAAPNAAGPITDAAVSVGDDTYTVLYFDFRTTRPAEAVFKETRDALTDKTKGHKETNLKLGDVEGRQLLTMETDGGIYIWHYYVKGSRYWQIGVSNRHGTVPPGAPRFFASFNLVTP